MNATQVHIEQIDGGFSSHITGYEGNETNLQLAAECIWRIAVYDQPVPSTPATWAKAFDKQRLTFKQPGAVGTFYATAIHSGLLELKDDEMHISAEAQKLCDAMLSFKKNASD